MVQAKAAAMSKPEAHQRYVEDFNFVRTPAWSIRCPFSVNIT